MHCGSAKPRAKELGRLFQPAAGQERPDDEASPGTQRGRHDGSHAERGHRRSLPVGAEARGGEGVGAVYEGWARITSRIASGSGLFVAMSSRS